MSLKLTLEIHAENAKDLPEWVHALFGVKDVKTSEVAASLGSECVVGPVSEGQVALDVAADEDNYVLRSGRGAIQTDSGAPPGSKVTDEKTGPQKRRRRTKAEMEAARAAEAERDDETHTEIYALAERAALDTLEKTEVKEAIVPAERAEKKEVSLDDSFDKDVYDLSLSFTPDRVAQLNAGREFISEYGLGSYDRIRDHLKLGRSPISDKDDEVVKHRAAMQIYSSRKDV